MDDAVERGIRSAVDRFATTQTGKRVLGGVLTFGAGAISEGLEELIGDWMEWQLPRVYGGETATAQETLENSLYDFLVGTVAGAMGGVVDAKTYRYGAGTGTKTQQGEITERDIIANPAQEVTLPKAEDVNVLPRPEQSATTAEQDGLNIEQGSLKNKQSGGGGGIHTESSGTESETTRTGRRCGVNEETIERVERISETVGRKILFYETDKAGENGYFDRSAGTLYINAKSGNAVSKIVGHELTHSIEQSEGYGDLKSLILRRIEQTGGDLAAMRREKSRQYADHGIMLGSEAEIDAEIVAEYVENNLLTDEDEIHALARTNRTLIEKIAAIIDELLAKLGNAGAQERVFLERAQKIYRSALGETKTAQETQRAKERKTALQDLQEAFERGDISEEEFNAAKAAVGQYSVEKTSGGKPFVEVERDILADVPESKWASVVKDNLKQKFPDGVTVGNSEIKIDRQSRREMTFSRYMQWLCKNDPEIRADKLRATDNTDEILHATTNWVNEGLNHPRSDNITDFARGEVLLRVGGNDYTADVVVGAKKNGSLVLYDILNLRPTSFTKKETATAITANPSPRTDRSTASFSGKSVTENGQNVKRQFSYAGEKAKTADIDHLKSAQEMEKLGADMESIRKATGWHMGRDGKWRFEIDDSGMEYRKNGDARLMQEEGYRRLEELTRKWADHYEKGGENLTEAESAEMERLQDEYSSRVWEEKYMLRDFLRHDALFEAYPRLNGVSLAFDSLDDGQKGYFDKRSNTIVLSDNLIGSEESTLLHEVQHVIQKIEGFSQGSSPAYWARRDAETGTVKRRLEQERANIFEGLSREERNKYTRYNELERELERLSGAEDGTEDGERYLRYDRESDKLYLELWEKDWFQKLGSLDRKLGNGLGEEYVRLYRNTAGEVEARDTASRRKMTTEQRRETAPDYGNENTVLAENAGNGYSISETEEKRKTQAGEKSKKKVQSFTRENLPKKAEGYLKRTERGLADDISDALSAPKYEKSGFLRETAQQVSAEYLKTGSVSDETRVRLFEDAYAKAIIVDDEFYRENKDVKDRLRQTPVTIKQDKSDIVDFNSFRKNAFGILRIVDSGGTPVDVFYDRLNGMAPELFPENITHPADQLVRMYEVGKSIRRSEWSLDKYYSEDAETYKEMARSEFNIAIENALGELRKVKRYAEDRAAQKQTDGLPDWVQNAESVTLEDVKRAYREIKLGRATYEKVAAKHLLTDSDEEVIEKLLAGRLGLENLNPQTDNVRGITEVYEARREHEELVGVIRAWSATQKQAKKAKADKYLETSINWKDKAGWRYATEIMERNLYDIIPDKALAKEIYNEYFRPVKEANADATRLKNRRRERVRELNLSREVVDGNEVSEAYAVQLYGEAMDNIETLKKTRGRMAERDGKTLMEWQAVVGDLWEKNPNLDRGKIENAIKAFRELYDELFEMMNEARLRNGYEPVDYRRGYFPHFQSDSEGGVIGLFGKALGIRTDVTALPTTINGMTHTFRPGIQWFSHAQRRKGYSTAYDAVEGFDRYIEGIADVIYQTDNIQNLRAFSSQMRYRASDEGIQKQVDAVNMNENFTEEEKRNKVETIYKDAKYVGSNFVTELEEYTNQLANKRSRMDREMERLAGRGMYNIAKSFYSRVGANMVAVNPGSWLTNFSPLMQANSLLSRGELLDGMWQTLKSYKEDDGIAARSAFLTTRKGSEPLVQTWVQETSAKLSSPMEMIDQFTAGAIVRAFYNQGLRKGLSEVEAMREADRLTNNVMAGRGKGDMPTMFESRNPLVKLFTQFQLEVNNQLRFVIKDLPRELGDDAKKAIALALLRFCVGSWLFDELYEFLVGRRCALDPLGILNDTVGDLTGWELPNLFEMIGGTVIGDVPSFETKKEDLYGAGVNLIGNVAEQVPFIGGLIGGGRFPVSSAFPDWDNLGKAIGKNDWSAKKKVSTGIKALSGTAAYTVLPFGGGQVKKVIQGLKTVIEGGSYTVDANGNNVLQYPVYTDSAGQAIWNAATATIFGKASTKTGREWVESGYPSFSAKQTAVYQGMLEVGVGQKDAFELICEMRDAEKSETESEAKVERDILRLSDISDAGKSVVFYGLLASERERALMDSLENTSEAGRVMMDIRDAETSAEKRELLEKSLLSDKEKVAAYNYLFGEKQEDGSYKHKRYGQFVEAGVSEIGAYKLSSSLDALAPEDGKKSVSSLQKYKVVAAANLGSREKLGALKAMMTDVQYKRVDIASSYGISVESYVAFLGALAEYGKSCGQDEVRDALDAMGGGSIALQGNGSTKITTAQQAVLWQLANKSWNAKSNPYSRSIGKKVYAQLNED